MLERTRKTTVYLNGEKSGSCDSLTTPHRYVLPQLTEGVYELLICVDNTDYPTKGGHLTSPDTQTNWNGITGKIQLELHEKYRMSDVRIFPDVENNSIKVLYETNCRRNFTAYVEGFEVKRYEHDKSGGFTYSPKEKMPLWSEYTPNVLTLVICFNGEEQRYNFGMRKIETDGLKIRVNGAETFLRGKHDGLVFPLTGFAPTSVSEWKRVFEKAKAYGINHYRFHSNT